MLHFLKLSIYFSLCKEEKKHALIILLTSKCKFSIKKLNVTYKSKFFVLIKGLREKQRSTVCFKYNAFTGKNHEL